MAQVGAGPARPFRFSIDRGGTFTDVYAEVPGSKGFRVLKLLSEDPHNYPDAPREGVRRILEVRRVMREIIPRMQDFPWRVCLSSFFLPLSF